MIITIITSGQYAIARQPRVKQDQRSYKSCLSDLAKNVPAVSELRQGLAGLMPRQRGPRHAHKLTEDVMAFILDCKNKKTSLQAADLATRIKQHFGLSVHPRSIERALQRQLKKGR